MSKKVLVVDDSLTIRNEFGRVLQAKGLTVITAVDGLDGLNKLREDPEIELILADINMPNMDGMTMLDRISEEFDVNRYKIIMVTSENTFSAKQRGRAHGITGWVVKPFRGESLANALLNII